MPPPTLPHHQALRRRLLRLLGALPPGTALAGLGTAGSVAAAAAPPPAPSPGPWAEAIARHGLVLLIRHARTDPGVGDPPGFRLDSCASQRNLSAEGRQQAVELGAVLRAQGLQPQAVRSSRWCRCLDTARLAFERVEPWPALDSFFGGQGDRDGQTAQLRTALQALPPGRVEAWVTHQVNASALTAETIAMGECLLLAGGRGRAEPLRRIVAAALPAAAMHRG